MLHGLLGGGGRGHQRGAVRPAGVVGLQRHHLSPREVLAVGQHVVDRDALRRGHLGVARHPAEALGEAGAGLVEAAGRTPYGARRPVDPAQLVEERPPHAGGGVAGERHPAVGLEPLGRLDQGRQAGGRQVVAVHVAGDPGHDLAHQVADERDVGGHQLVNRRVDLRGSPVDVTWVTGRTGAGKGRVWLPSTGLIVDGLWIFCCQIRRSRTRRGRIEDRGPGAHGPNGPCVPDPARRTGMARPGNRVSAASGCELLRWAGHRPMDVS